MTSRKVKVTQTDREELARLIKDGYTSGRLDGHMRSGRAKYISWKLETVAWTE